MLPAEQPLLVVLCAWCLQEKGIAPDPRESHGICTEHARKMAEQSQARKLARQKCSVV